MNDMDITPTLSIAFFYLGILRETCRKFAEDSLIGFTDVNPMDAFFSEQPNHFSKIHVLCLITPLFAITPTTLVLGLANRSQNANR